MAGIGLVGVGAWVLEARTSRGHRARNRLGVETGPDHSVAPSAGGSLEDGILTSSRVPVPVRWTIAHPPSALGQPTGIVYCLHGRGGSHRTAFDHMRLHDEVAAAGVPLVVAGVDGGDHSYWHPRADGSDARAMLTSEFMPLVADKVGTALPMAVIGWSMGGYGALLLAESGLAGPKLRAVAVASPALWTAAAQTPAGAFDSADDFRTHDVFAGRPSLSSLPVMLHCGTADPFYAAAKRFSANPTAGLQAIFSAGAHDDGYWRSVAPTQVRFLAAALAR